MGHPSEEEGVSTQPLIDWKTLWSNPPPEIESGVIPPPSREQSEEMERLLWEKFEEFSLGTS